MSGGLHHETVNAQSVREQRAMYRLLTNVYTNGHPWRYYCRYVACVARKDVKGRDSLGDLNVDGRIILKRVLKTIYFHV
jgi:hypothetical protein